MYTELKNVQIVISLLKQFNINKIIVSPGSRNVPFVHSVEQDDFFECYSIVDERSAAYFALGLSMATNDMVVFTCTSSTATTNYLPAIINAKQKGAKIIALTFDRDYRKLCRMEDQMIDQVNMYGDHVVDSTNIPIASSPADVWYETSEINRVLWNAVNKCGPVQINIQIDNFGAYNCEELPTARKVEMYSHETFEREIEDFKKILKNKRRILVWCGQAFEVDLDLERALLRFQEKYNSVVAYDEFSAAKNPEFVKTVLVTESMHLEEFERYCPDLVITIGGHSWSFMKYKLRHLSSSFEHWQVGKNIEMKDAFNALTKVIHIGEQEFFKEICLTDNQSDKKYLKLWKKRLDKVVMPDFEYSNFMAIKKLSKIIPNGSPVHLSILNSIRIFNFVGCNNTLKVYANLGTDGIDGCLSTYLGQSTEKKQLAFLIIGDLSALYDMSAFQYLKQANQRVFIINNSVGSEFYNNFGSYIGTVDDYIGARHRNKLETVCELSDIDYISAKNERELDEGLSRFVSGNSKPMVFEVFTDAHIDTKMLSSYYKCNLYSDLSIKFQKIRKRLHLK